MTAVSSADEKALSGDLSHIGGNLGVAGEKFDFSAVARYPDPFECVRDPNVDAVDICLPTVLHAPVALEALKHGKHVLVEKPMALATEDCDAMIAEARKQNRVLMSAHVLRFMPAYLPLIDGVKSGRFGTVRHALFRRRCAAPKWSPWLTDKKASGGGVADLLIHDIDMMIACFGAPSTLRAFGHENLPGGLDLITAIFGYEDGLTVTVTGGWHLPESYPFSMEYTVAGDDAVLEFSSAGREPTWYGADGKATPAELATTDGYQAEIEYFVASCRANAWPERCAPESSALAVRLAQLASEARALKGETVSCQ